MNWYVVSQTDQLRIWGDRFWYPFESIEDAWVFVSQEEAEYEIAAIRARSDAVGVLRVMSEEQLMTVMIVEALQDVGHPSLMGFRGDSILDTGYVFAPYIPLQFPAVPE